MIFKMGLKTYNFQKNLTIQENEGLKWYQKITRTRTSYITKVEKGGSILIMDAEKVNKIILEKLENQTKFKKIKEDPQVNIKKE